MCKMNGHRIFCGPTRPTFTWKILLARVIAVFGLRQRHVNFLKIPLHSSQVTIWCGFTATFIVGSFFSKNAAPKGLWHAPSSVKNMIHYYSNSLFQLFRQGDAMTLQRLYMMVLLHISNAGWNKCFAAISMTTESLTGNFLQLGFLDPTTPEFLWFLAAGTPRGYGLPWSCRISTWP